LRKDTRITAGELGNQEKKFSHLYIVNYFFQGKKKKRYWRTTSYSLSASV